MVTSDTHILRPTYGRVFLFNNCVQFTTFGKDLLQYFRKYKQVFLLLVIMMESIKSNVSVNFVEGIHWFCKRFCAISRHHDSQIILLSPITAFLYQDNTTGLKS